MTSKERSDTILDNFKRMGLRRWTVGINPPNERKESIVTLTNNIRSIEKLAGEVVLYADERRYEQAHCALDDIEKKVRELRRHIDHLQFVNYFNLHSAGVNLT